MKKIFLMLGICLFLSGNAMSFKSNAALDNTLNRAELENIGDAIHKKAEACHNALEAGKIKQALTNAQEAVKLNEQFRAKAKKYDFKIVRYMINGETPSSNKEIGDPMWYNDDLPEVILLSKVMLGKISLLQTIEENEEFTQRRGIIGLLTGNFKYAAVDYIDIGEAFKAYKDCTKEVDAAFEAGVAVISGKDVCSKPL